ncbi:hypothetical protein [Pseudomonas mucidolens]|uniref:hypothetical protein n=1 Tax=Pseudomonas mucidolens TaxID=46679 RepID=UPI0009FE577F|nr:hypothetical protein [Pseudomonas mucidolens]
MTFLESINIGISKAKNESKDIEIISKLFDELNVDLQKISKNIKILIRETHQQGKDKDSPKHLKHHTYTSCSLQLCHKFGIETYAQLASLKKKH